MQEENKKRPNAGSYLPLLNLPSTCPSAPGDYGPASSSQPVASAFLFWEILTLCETQTQQQCPQSQDVQEKGHIVQSLKTNRVDFSINLFPFAHKEGSSCSLCASEATAVTDQTLHCPNLNLKQCCSLSSLNCGLYWPINT